MLNNINWEFPLPRTHTGIPLGNATTGLLIWGEGRQLKITVGRADLWDHRGGMRWSPKQNLKAIRQCLEAGDEEGIRAIFKTDTEGISGQPSRPSIMPVGRIDLLLSEDAVLNNASLRLDNAELEIRYTRSGTDYSIFIELSMAEQEFYIRLAQNENFQINTVPAYEYLHEYFQSAGIVPPEIIKEENKSGWIQALPVDPAFGIACRENAGLIHVVNTRGENLPELKRTLYAALENAVLAGTQNITSVNLRWWSDYWRDVPEVNIPNAKLRELYYFGLYKFAALTNPSGVAATLQGPWIEEYRLPPWSSDYHFNINVQMCYWPAFKANHPEHLKPMFDMVWSWREQLRRNAEYFVGIKDGYMLPHAVDDRCVCMGSFWTGTIDHACSAWVAQMMYQYVCQTGDKDFLIEVAFPFMKGVMRVFEAMLEQDDDGRYYLPVSVSPEYRGAQMNAWGRNASFQLAAIRRLAENLIEAAPTANAQTEPVWKNILDKLPEYSIFEENDNPRIGLWDGVDLEESHRHHSHLGGICPFDTIDIADPEKYELINNSIFHWYKQGMGQWSGWCIPWASMLNSRLGNGDMAEMLLDIMIKVFMNEGRGTLHDCMFSGLTVAGFKKPLGWKEQTLVEKLSPDRDMIDVMQLDAGMGAVVAVQDMLMHSRRGINYIFSGVPRNWRDVAFENMPDDKGFLVSAALVANVLQPIRVKSIHGGVFRIANPWGDAAVRVKSDGMARNLQVRILELNIPAGTELELSVQA
ncbi:MAG: hypothetical protein JXR78_06085 [Victivallales bacterium]|nr:hypothetical protein [Victivallales bacterium]